MRSIDLNADMGESFGRWSLGDDQALVPLITSANIACGFHAGDPATLLRTCEMAADAGVVIGAQVGYRDLAGFGRRFIDATPDELYADVLFQIGALDGLARSIGARVEYVKPHGALYNTIVTHEAQAEAVVQAVADYGRELAFVGLPGSASLRFADLRGMRCVAEAFADRAYTDDGTLVSRREPGAVLHDPAEVARRVVQMVTSGVVESITGNDVAVTADSVCLHGDSPGAVEMAAAVRTALDESGVEVRAALR